MKVSRVGEWEEEQDHRVYRTRQGSSVVGWMMGRRPLAGSEKVFTSLEVGLDGTLWKMGSWHKNWKQRFFVLRQDRLSYYESSKSLKLLGEVRLVDNDRVATVSTVDDREMSVRCAATARVLRLRSETVEDKDRWITAMTDAIERRGEHRPSESVSSRKKMPESRRLLGIQATAHITGVKSDAALFLVLFVEESSMEQTPPIGKKKRWSDQTFVDEEDGCYDSDDTEEDFSCTTNKLLVSSPAAIRANGRRWREIARTEVVKPGDMGALACADGTIVRQFAVLLPSPANKWPEGALLGVYRRTNGYDSLSRHRRLMNVELDAAEEYCCNSKLVLLKRCDADEDEERDDDANREGRLRLTGIDATGIEPLTSRREFVYARQHYQFRSIVDKAYGHVLASEALCVPQCTSELPAALLRLVVSERTTLAHDIFSQVHDAATEKRRVASELRTKVDEAAAAARDKTSLRLEAEAILASLQQDADDDDADLLRRRLKTALFDEEAALERHRELEILLVKIETLASGFRAVESELERYAETLDKVYSSRGHDVLLATEQFDNEPMVGGGRQLANVHVAESRCRPFLKRSTQKKERDLQFAPTNLNWHQLKARRLEDDAVVESSTVTFGATAAHSKQFGFKDGGLSRLLDKIPAYSPPLATRQSKQYQQHSTLAAAWSSEKPPKPSWFFSAPPSPPKDAEDKCARLDRAVSRHLGSATEQRKTRAARCLSLHLFGGLDAATVPVVEECFDRRNNLAGECEAAAAFAARTSLASRVDVVLSQALALAGAHVEAVISRADPDVLERAVAPTSVDDSAGRMILGIECLLSTLNDELGMLEDLVVAAEWLSTLRFRFVQRRVAPSIDARKESTRLGRQADDEPSKWRVRRSEKGDGSLVVDLVVEGETAAALERAAEGRGEIVDDVFADDTAPFRVVASTRIDCVLFSQGINEWQTVANNFGTTFVLQSDVNAVGLQRLRDHVDWAERVCRERALGDADRAARVDATVKRWRLLLAWASDAVLDSSTQKNVHLLLKTSDLCRELVGSHCICCKSGKDRTSMAVTLEQTRVLAAQLGVFDEKHVCKLMRRHGVRRVNIIANTDQDKYAFNAVQVKSLPRCYRPPRGTYAGTAPT